MNCFILFSLCLVCLPLLVLSQPFGGSWNQLNFSTAMIFGSAFADGSNGWFAAEDSAANQAMVRTSDGGKTFVFYNTSSRAIFLTDLAIHSIDNGITTGIGLIWSPNAYTHDGLNWKRELKNITTQQTQGCNIVEGSSGLGYGTVGQFQNVDTKNPNNNYNLNGVGISKDGGVSYEYTDCQADVYARYAAFPSPTMYVVACGQFPSNEHLIDEEGRYHMSYRLKPRLPNHRQPLKRLPIKSSLAVSNSSGFYGQIQLSTDAGQTWTNVFTNTTLYFNQISCPTTQICFAAAEDATDAYIYISRDGAQTWQQSLFDEGGSLMATWATSETEFWVAGGDFQAVVGKAWRSTDAGETWQLTSAMGGYFMSISMPENSEGVGYATAATPSQSVSVFKYTPDQKNHKKQRNQHKIEIAQQ